MEDLFGNYAENLYLNTIRAFLLLVIPSIFLKLYTETECICHTFWIPAWLKLFVGENNIISIIFSD